MRALIVPFTYQTVVLKAIEVAVTMNRTTIAPLPYVPVTVPASTILLPEVETEASWDVSFTLCEDLAKASELPPAASATVSTAMSKRLDMGVLPPRAVDISREPLPAWCRCQGSRARTLSERPVHGRLCGRATRVKALRRLVPGVREARAADERGARTGWVFLTNHAHVLLQVAWQPDANFGRSPSGSGSPSARHTGSWPTWSRTAT